MVERGGRSKHGGEGREGESEVRWLVVFVVCVGGEEREGASGFGCSTVFQQLHSRHLVSFAVGRYLEKVALESKALDSSLQTLGSSDDPLDRTGMCEPGPSSRVLYARY